jgi:RNA polymerase primary sigma factor
MNHEDADPCFQHYVRQIVRYPLLTRSEETALAKKVLKGNKSAKERMINSNLRLVVRIAKSFANMGVPLMDLISEGNIGLMKAVERYDPSRGGKFSTYGVWWIRQAVQRALSDQGRTIRLPVHLVDKIGKLRRIGANLSSELGREATDMEIAEEMGLEAAKIQLLKQASSRPASLDAPIGGDDGGLLGDLIGDASAEDPYECMSEKSGRAELSEMIQLLNERERAIITARFGLEGKDSLTLKEVGERFSVSRERIRQIEREAISKMRRGYALREKLRPIVPRHSQRRNRC